jgi:Bacterial capsule synthesis protein PGA_cap
MQLNELFRTGHIDFPTRIDAEEWTLSATGDYGILPQLETTISENGIESLADNIKALTQADISITNLEVALCDKDEVSGHGVRGDGELFKKIHKATPFSVYSFANNHVLDAGPEALNKTFAYFDTAGISYVGAGQNQKQAETPLFIEQGGVTLGILAFAQNENQIAGDMTPGVAELLPDKVIKAAEVLIQQCDVPIVIMHDGFEFMDFPRIEFRDLCRKLAELGIKLVIAHHSHVPQGIEKINDSLIFYSLGNFLFDQPHFKPYEWSRTSFVPVITFKGRKIAGIELRPLVIETEPLNVRPCNEEERVAILTHLKINTSIISDKYLLKSGIERFYTNILLPEFFGFIRRYGDEHNDDYSELIEKFKHKTSLHNIFSGFLALYAKK